MTENAVGLLAPALSTLLSLWTPAEVSMHASPVALALVLSVS